MCFSAVASFSAAITLAIIGASGAVINLMPARFMRLLKIQQGFRSDADTVFYEQCKSDAQFWWPFLVTPLLFSVQQLCEGFVWIYLNGNGNPLLAAYCYTFFAYCLWPLWIPFIALVLELRGKYTSTHLNPLWIPRISLLLLFQCAGCILFIFMLMSISAHGLTVFALNGHIVYRITLFGHADSMFVTIPYLVCTVVPFALLWSVPGSWIFSLTAGGSALASYLLYSAQKFPSTWCFFAAWLSIQAVLLRVWNLKLTAESYYRTENSGRERVLSLSEPPGSELCVAKSCAIEGIVVSSSV